MWVTCSGKCRHRQTRRHRQNCSYSIIRSSHKESNPGAHEPQTDANTVASPAAEHCGAVHMNTPRLHDNMAEPRKGTTELKPMTQQKRPVFQLF